MQTDNQTNTLYLADILPKKHPVFFAQFEKVLHGCGIDFQLLPNTKDIWAVDYMPVQVSKEKYIQFTYNPDYIRYKKYLKTISDVDGICKSIGLYVQKSDLVVDGGNILKWDDTVMMCDKVFHENRHLPEKVLISQLKELFETDRLFFVPWDKADYTGHIDGMVRFIDGKTVLINDYSGEDARFQRAFRMAIHNAGFDWVELPYSPSNKKSSAQGVYLNYLHMSQAVIVPVFGNNIDDKVLNVIETVFKGQMIATVEANEIAKLGGILNCITWNVCR